MRGKHRWFGTNGVPHEVSVIPATGTTIIDCTCSFLSSTPVPSMILPIIDAHRAMTTQPPTPRTRRRTTLPAERMTF